VEYSFGVKCLEQKFSLVKKEESKVPLNPTGGEEIETEEKKEMRTGSTSLIRKKIHRGAEVSSLLCKWKEKKTSLSSQRRLCPFPIKSCFVCVCVCRSRRENLCLGVWGEVKLK